MPKPIYTVLCQNWIESKETGLVTLVEIIEKIVLAHVPTPPSGEQVLLVPWQPIRAVAVWMLMPDDPEDGSRFGICCG